MLGSLKQSTSNEEIYKASNCTLFVQQLWRNEICKHCFRTESEHSVNISRSNENINSDNNIGTTLTTSNSNSNSNNNINSPTLITTSSLSTTTTTPNKNINNYIKNFNNNNTTTTSTSNNTTNNNNSNYYLTPNKYCKVTSKSGIVPSVDKAPLSIRRSLTPSAIEKFSRQISSQLLVQEPLSPKTIINNINTNNNPLSPPQKQKPPLPLKTYIDTTTTSSTTSANTTPDLSSPNLTSFSLDNNTQTTTTTTTTSSSPNKQQNTTTPSSPSQSSPILLSLSEFHHTPQNSRQMRSHSDSPADYNISVSSGGTTTISTSSASSVSNNNINSLSSSNASTSSLSSTNSSNISSGSKPINIASGNLIYEKKHTRNLSGSGYNSLGSSPINSSPLLFSQQQSLQAQSSKLINSLSSSNNSNNSISSSPRKYSIFVGKSKQTKMNNQNHVNNQSTPNLPKRQQQLQSVASLKSSSYPNVADATHQHQQHQVNFQLNNSILSNSQITLNEEQNKIFYAINSILSSLPGISNNAVYSIMDILYSQNCIDIDSNNTLIKADKLADLTKATATFQQLIERQDYLCDVITVQSCVRRFLSRRRTEWLSQVYNGSILKDRNNEFRGLIQLERKYNEKLDITINTYYRPLKAANLISRMDLQSIFSSTKEIYYVHKRILLQFEELFKKFPTCEGIGDLILRIAPELKIYGGYVKNFKNAIDTLISCQENPKFASFLKECCDNTPGKVYDLMALIAAPLNHLTGYERQLFNIALYTPQNWPDYVNVINAVTMMKEVEHLVQDNLGQAQNAATLMTIYRKINNRRVLPDPFVIPTRIFIHEGRLVKFELKKQDQIYFYYLCNDLILFVKKGNGLINSGNNGGNNNGGSLNNSNANNSGNTGKEIYKLKNMFMLQDVIVSDLQDTAVHKNIISILNNPTKEIYSFSIEDPREKKELVKQFSKLCMMSTNKSTKIFGISLVDLIQREEDMYGNSSDSITGGIPTFIIKLCNEILSNHLNEEGIFRISPNQSELDILKESLNKSATPSLMDQSISKANGHQLAALLKSFFRELSIPLLTFELFDKVIEIGDYQDTNDIDYQIQEIKSLLSTIPIVNQHILQLVLLLLTRVADNCEVNKMSSINLAIVFAPNLLKPKNQTIETSLKIPIINNVITTLLDNYQLLYSDKLNFIKIIDSKFQFNCISSTSSSSSSSKTNNNSFNYSKK